MLHVTNHHESEYTKKYISTGNPGGRKNASSATQGLKPALRHSVLTPVLGASVM